MWEVLALLSGLIVVIGLWFERECYSKKTNKTGYYLVILGVFLEVIFGGFSYCAQSSWIFFEEKQLAGAVNENTQLEKAVAPRILSQGDFLRNITSLPRVPIYIASVSDEDSVEFADQLASALVGIQIGPEPLWDAARVPPVSWAQEGITVLYEVPLGFIATPQSENVAVGICEALKSQQFLVRVQDIPLERPFTFGWPAQLPPNGIYIKIGRRPDAFWANKMFQKRTGQAEMTESFCNATEIDQNFHQKLRNYK